MRIVVLDGHTLNPGDQNWDAVAELGDLTIHPRSAASEIVERARGAQIIIINKAQLNRETITQLPDLRFISILATGYNVVDVKCARERSIPVSNVPEYGTDTVAQYVFAAIQECSNHIALHAAAVKAGDWQRSLDWCFWRRDLVELVGLKIGIVGFGRIGRRVSELANCFKMQVLAFDTREENPPSYPGFRWASIETLFSEADVVTLHCPLTDENAGMVNRELLEKMKPNALLINAARGGLVVEEDLAAALNAGKLGGAVVDVVSSEPISAANPLLSARNCMITPHIAWATLAARKRIMQTTAHNIAAFLRGCPIHVINGL